MRECAHDTPAYTSVLPHQCSYGPCSGIARHKAWCNAYTHAHHDLGTQCARCEVRAAFRRHHDAWQLVVKATLCEPLEDCVLLYDQQAPAHGAAMNTGKVQTTRQTSTRTYPHGLRTIPQACVILASIFSSMAKASLVSLDLCLTYLASLRMVMLLMAANDPGMALAAVPAHAECGSMPFGSWVCHPHAAQTLIWVRKVHCYEVCGVPHTLH